MADDQEASNEVADEVEEPEISDYDEAAAAAVTSSTSTVAPVPQDVASTPVIGADEYDDEPIPDYVVNLVVDGTADASNAAKDLVNAAVTDSYGNALPTKTSALIDAFNSYSTAVYDELNGNTTAIADERKRFWGWSIRSLIIFGLIALCLLGLVLACLILVLGKKFRKNKRTTTTGATTTTKAVVTKGIAPDQRYQQVPNV